MSDLRTKAGQKVRLFVDMDGTFCKWQHVEQFEKLLEKGFFLSMDENQSVVAAVREIISNRKDIEVYTLSATLAENPYAIEEKDAWLTAHIPELDTSHRLYSRCGSQKSEIVPGGNRASDVLLDDYTHNLLDWSKCSRGMKLCNGINDTRKTWQGARAYASEDSTALANDIAAFCLMQN